jgi:cytochrome b561
MRLFLAVFFSTIFFQLKAQDELLKDLMQTQDTTTSLLPKKMLFTQRIFWGEHGLLRGASPLNAVNREKELKLRRGMLVTHQVLGLATLGGMIGQGIVGSKLYNAKGNDYVKLKDIHEGLGLAVNLTYSTTAIMSLFTPPPLINRDKKASSIRIHKWLAIVHMTGMIATNILAGMTEDNYKLKPYHRAAAYATFASYGAAVIAIKF